MTGTCSTTATSCTPTIPPSASAGVGRRRSEQELPVDQPGTVVVERRTAGDVFAYKPSLINPTFVEVHLEVPQAGDRANGYTASLDLDDGVYLRNTDVG